MPNRRKLDAPKIARQVVADYALPSRGKANHRIFAPLVTAVRLGHEAGCACIYREDDARRIAADIASTVDVVDGKVRPIDRDDLQTMIQDGIQTYFEEYHHD